MFGTLINFILGFIGGIIVARVMLFPLYLLNKENEEINEIDELEELENEVIVTEELDTDDPDIYDHIPRID